jgi:hypothetical protein
MDSRKIDPEIPDMREDVATRYYKIMKKWNRTHPTHMVRRNCGIEEKERDFDSAMMARIITEDDNERDAGNAEPLPRTAKGH